MATKIERPALVRVGEPQPPGTIPALAGLVRDLVGADPPIRWCSWKSNEHLAKALSGRTDLDLLVLGDDAMALRMVLAAHGLKRLTPAPTREHPGMEHHLGMDREDGRLFHLHVHTQLVLGEQYVKNHNLPMEVALLAGSRSLDGVPVPDPSLELAVLVVRALLKYRARDIVKDVLSIRSPGLKDEVRAELEWLLERTDVASVRNAVRSAGEPVPAELVGSFLEAYQRDPRSGRRFARLRSQLRRSLSARRREGHARSRLRALRIGLHERRHGARMTPAGGGLTVAFVGSDGSGKSTVTAEVARWLDWKVDTRIVYLGSKSPSRRTRWSYVVFRVLRRGQRSVAARRGEDAWSARTLAWTRDVVRALHESMVGSDRVRRTSEGRRLAAAGAVVLFDRFPMQALSEDSSHRVLDGPRIARMVPQDSRVVRRLARAEERRYAGLGLPDLVVFLTVDAAVAEARKPDHEAAVLRAKTRAVGELAALGERAALQVRSLVVDAGRPLADVVLAVERGIWDVL